MVHKASTTMKRVVEAAICFYQTFLSPYSSPQCRFSPSCSRYASEAIARYGVVKGSLKTVLRLARCHPLHPGGYDPVSS